MPYVYGFVNMSNTELTQLGSFLVDLRDKELALATETAGSAAHTQLVNEKQQLETNISLFIADKVHMDNFDMKAAYQIRRLITAFLILWNCQMRFWTPKGLLSCG